MTETWLTLAQYLEASGLSRRTFFRRRQQIEARRFDGVMRYKADNLNVDHAAPHEVTDRKLKELGRQILIRERADAAIAKLRSELRGVEL